MKATSVVLLLLLLAGTAHSASYRGGSLTAAPVHENTDGTLQVSFHYRENGQAACLRQLSYRCDGNNCSGSPDPGAVQTDQDTSGQERWCQTEGFTTKTVPSQKSFSLSSSGCCWVSNGNGSMNWTSAVELDLGIRSDTHSFNKCPVTATVATIRTHQNCFSKLPLLAYDADRDHVRCRFAANASVDSAFILDENACTVKLKGNAGLGVHVFDLLLEDFPRRDVTLSYADGTSSVRTAFNASSNADSPPFSRVSLQFTLEVLPPLSSCDAGHVVPKLLQPTPSNGGVLYAAVGAPLQLVVLATANQAKIYDFQVSGPVNVTKRFSEDQFGKAEVTLSWRPLPRDLRRAVPLCFAAETNVSQSEMRCVVIIVTRSPTAEGKASVSCSATQMTVVLEKATMPDIDKNWLKLADPSCSLTSNNTHIMATMSFSTCGTTVEDKVDYIVFKNTIISFERPNTIITRRRQVDIGFSCQFPKSLSVSSHYQLDRSDYVFTESSFGSFQYNFEVFNDNNFTQRVEPGAYPVEVKLMDVIYMGIQAKSDLPDVSLFVESCRATPENNPKSILLYDLIQNGCLRDETVKVHPSNSTSFLFEIQAFKFNGNYDEVYISCSVLLCENGNPASRCAQGCLKSPQRRRKRNDVRETASHFITQGPLRFVRQADSGAVAKEPKGDSGEEVGARGFLGTNTGTVVFASLFAVSVVTLAVIVALLTRKKKKVEDARGLLVFDSEY